jgi:hypothetical protein
LGSALITDFSARVRWKEGGWVSLEVGIEVLKTQLEPEIQGVGIAMPCVEPDRALEFYQPGLDVKINVETFRNFRMEA